MASVPAALPALLRPATNAARTRRRVGAADVLMLASVLYAADLFLTVGFATTTGFWEANAAALAVARATGSAFALTSFKVVATAPAILLLARYRRTRAGRLGALAALGVAVTITAHWAAYLAIVLPIDAAELARVGAMDANYVRIGW